MIYDNLITEYADIFNRLSEQGKDPYTFLGLRVPLKILSELYSHLRKFDDIPSLEVLKLTDKQKYWQIACCYYEDNPARIKASQAAYVLTLITSTE